VAGARGVDTGKRESAEIPMRKRIEALAAYAYIRRTPNIAATFRASGRCGANYGRRGGDESCSIGCAEEQNPRKQRLKPSPQN
jgi:hypothetical protein